MAELKPCPFCGSKSSKCIRVVGGEYVALIIEGYGAITPRVCLNCGIVYVPKEEEGKLWLRK